MSIRHTRNSGNIKGLDAMSNIKIKELSGYEKKYVVCYSGGHSSAICAINAVLRYGKENVILLNHDISSSVEDRDIKRFKIEVAEYLGLPITFANHKDFENMTPIKVCVDLGGWKFHKGDILCTNRLKTAPFYKWIKENDPEHNHVYLYGFDNTPDERVRMNKRIAAMGAMGCKTDYPLITWGKLKVENTEDVGIERPNVYSQFQHANCIGCLKAGWQHWYCVYVHRRELWDEVVNAEENEIKHSLKSSYYFLDRQDLFEKMRLLGVPTTEHIEPNRFWATAKKMVRNAEDQNQLFLMQEHDDVACTSCTG